MILVLLLLNVSIMCKVSDGLYILKTKTVLTFIHCYCKNKNDVTIIEMVSVNDISTGDFIFRLVGWV